MPRCSRCSLLEVQTCRPLHPVQDGKPRRQSKATSSSNSAAASSGTARQRASTASSTHEYASSAGQHQPADQEVQAADKVGGGRGRWQAVALALLSGKEAVPCPRVSLWWARWASVLLQSNSITACFTAAGGTTGAVEAGQCGGPSVCCCRRRLPAQAAFPTAMHVQGGNRWHWGPSTQRS